MEEEKGLRKPVGVERGDVYKRQFYKSPRGHDIEGVGVTPDVMVGLAEGEDNQKALALETAQSLVLSLIHI